MWGTDDLAFLSRYDGLSCIRLTRLGAFALGLVDDVAAPPTASAGRLEILPNLHVVPADGDVDGRDEAFLSTFCRRGAGGFGYDPVFMLPERGCSVAELPAAEKNSLSHRARALAGLKSFLKIPA